MCYSSLSPDTQIHVKMPITGNKLPPPPPTCHAKTICYIGQLNCVRKYVHKQYLSIIRMNECGSRYNIGSRL
jgi:hypothetical protein